MKFDVFFFIWFQTDTKLYILWFVWFLGDCNALFAYFMCTQKWHESANENALNCTQRTLCLSH